MLSLLPHYSSPNFYNVAKIQLDRYLCILAPNEPYRPHSPKCLTVTYILAYISKTKKNLFVFETKTF